MHPSLMASRRAAPALKPTTGNIHTHTHLDSTSEDARAFAMLQATSDATMARLYLANGNVPAARRKAVQLLKALQSLEVRSASPCTTCRDNFPLPDGPMDFFDTHVVANYVSRRAACTQRPNADKPCLKGGAA